MDEFHFDLKSLDQLPQLAKELLVHLKEPVVLFKGDLGAGKTTLIKALCKELGVDDDVSSPTFSLVNEYKGLKGENVFHFDWYRIDDESEALDIGWDDYLDRGDYLFIEWPEKIRNLIPDQFALIQIDILSAERRRIRLSHHT